MALNSESTGRSTRPVRLKVDRRWTMAFAAALGETDPRYFDTRADEGLAVHPVFPVCVDWQVMAQGVPGLAELPLEEARRGVHVGHDLELHRRVPSDVEVTTWATLEGVERRRPGAYAVIRHEATGPSGEALWTSRMGVLLLDVEVDGNERPARVDPGAAEGPEPSDADAVELATLRIAPGASHIYTECSRIWNPIHTDARAAATAGFDQPILHGTATLALATSHLIAGEADGDHRRVKRVAARLGAPVLPGAVLTVRSLVRRRSTIRFDVVDGEGTTVVGSGVLDLRA